MFIYYRHTNYITLFNYINSFTIDNFYYLLFDFINNYVKLLINIFNSSPYLLILDLVYLLY